MDHNSTPNSTQLGHEHWNIMICLVLAVSSFGPLMFAHEFRALSHRKKLQATLSKLGVKVPVKLDNFSTKGLNIKGGRFAQYWCAAHFETMLNPKTGEQSKVTIQEYQLCDLPNYVKHSVVETPFYITYSPEKVNQFALDFELTAPYAAKPHFLYYYIFSYTLAISFLAIILLSSVEVVIFQLGIQIFVLMVFKYYYCSYYSKNIEVTNILAKGITVKPVNGIQRTHVSTGTNGRNSTNGSKIYPFLSPPILCPPNLNPTSYDKNTSNKAPNQKSSIYVSVGFDSQYDN